MPQAARCYGVSAKAAEHGACKVSLYLGTGQTLAAKQTGRPRGCRDQMLRKKHAADKFDSVFVKDSFADECVKHLWGLGQEAF
jgi:hypothetical protein